MSLPARISFSQIGIFISIIVYIGVRGFLALMSLGAPFWTQVGGYLSVIFPLAPVIVLGFTACVISYAFSYLGLWMMDKDFFILGEVTIFLSVVIIPGALAIYSWFGFTVV